MRETRTSGSEGGEPQANGTSLPLSFVFVWFYRSSGFQVGEGFRSSPPQWK